MKRALLTLALLSVGPTVRPSDCQSPRAANPERPTVATHAYTVVPGYVELEQGGRAFGVDGLREATAWEFNLKIGLTDGLQLGVFGAGYLRTSGGAGVGDVGGSLKWGRALTARSAVALVPAVTVPTGDEGRGLGAGRALGSLVAVYSADLPAALHFDFNAGPVGIGEGRPQWFTSLGLARGGAVGVAFELFDFTAGAAGPQQRGLLGAALVTLAEWAVVDVGAVLGLTRESPDQVFLGVTTNVGRIFK
jgi:hypothetical protein